MTSFPPPPTSNKSEVIVVGADTTIVNEQDEFEDEVGKFGSKFGTKWFVIGPNRSE